MQTLITVFGGFYFPKRLAALCVFIFVFVCENTFFWGSIADTDTDTEILSYLNDNNIS